MCQDLHTFLLDPNKDLRELNSGDRCFSALVCVPDTYKVRLVYGLGFGTAGIGQPSPLARKVLSLFGEGGVLGCPQVLMLPETTCSPTDVATPTATDTDDALHEGHQLGTRTHMARDVHTTTPIMP